MGGVHRCSFLRDIQEFPDMITIILGITDKDAVRF